MISCDCLVIVVWLQYQIGKSPLQPKEGDISGCKTKNGHKQNYFEIAIAKSRNFAQFFRLFCYTFWVNL